MTAPGEFVVSAEFDGTLAVRCPACDWTREAYGAGWPTLSALLRLAESHASEHRQEATR